MLALFMCSCAAALAGAPHASAACPHEDVRPDAGNLPEIRAALICLHNEERTAAGVAPLRANAQLSAAADGHARDMVARRYFSHDTPSGLDPFDRMKQAGYVRRGLPWDAGETIAWATGDLSTPRSVMDAWLKDSGQRLTLLAPDFSDIGVGVELGAPRDPDEGAAPAVTYALDYGWRASAKAQDDGRRASTKTKALRRCMRHAAKKRRPVARRAARTRCRGLNARGLPGR